jgi:hypothetical protein
MVRTKPKHTGTNSLIVVTKDTITPRIGTIMQHYIT